MNNLKYLGTGWAFPVCFDKELGVMTVSGEEDIRQSLEILFSTLPGERIFRFEYGCGLQRWVFSTLTVSERARIAREVEYAILEGEPRIKVEQIAVEIKDQKEGILWITLFYQVRRTNSRSSIVYPYYIKEGTNL